MTVDAHLHDGTVMHFPDGTDPAVVQAAVKKYLGNPVNPDAAGASASASAPAAPPAAGPSDTQNPQGKLSSVGQGIATAIPFEKDIKAAAAALDVGAHNIAGSDTGMTMGGAFDAAKKDFDAEQADAAKNQPLMFYPGALAGGAVAATGVKNAITAGAPKAAAALAAFAKLHPYLATSGTAGAVGGLYGLGEGTGTDRLANAGKSAAVSAVVSPLALYGANKVGSAVGSALGKLQEYFQPAEEDAAGTAVAAAPTEFSNITAKPTTETPTLSDLRQKQNVIGLTPGVISGDVDKLRMENDARQGLLGKENQAVMANIDAGMIDDTKAATQALAGNKTGSSDDILSKSVSDLRARASAAKQVVSKAYGARDEALATAVADVRKVGPALGKQLSDVVEDPKMKYAFQTSGNAPAKALYEDYKNIINEANANGGQLPIGRLTAWRQDVSDVVGKNLGTQTAKLAGALGKAFDGWIEGSDEAGSGLKPEMLLSGDPNVGALANAARQSRAAYGRVFESNTGVGQSAEFENMTSQLAKTPLQFARDNFSNLKGGSDTSQIVSRMIKAMPEEDQKPVADNVFHGLVAKAFEKADDKGGFSIIQLRNGLNDIKNSVTYKENLMDPERHQVLSGLIDDLNRHIQQTGRRDVVSPSGGAVMRGVNALVAKLPGVNAAAKMALNAKEAGQEFKSGIQLQRALKAAGGDIAKRAGAAAINPALSSGLVYGTGAATGMTVGTSVGNKGDE